MSQKHAGLGLTGDHTEREPMWGGQLDLDIAAMSHMSYPALKELKPKLNGTASGVSPGDFVIIGTGTGWRTLPDGSSSRGHLAMRDLGRWYYYRVREGMIVYVKNQSSDNNGNYPPGLYLYNGTAWVDLVTSAQDFSYASLTGAPEPMWYKTWITANKNISNIGLLASSSSLSTTTTSSSTSKVFDGNGLCISPGFYDIRYQIQTNSRVNRYGKLELKIIKNSFTILAETAIAFADLDNSPYTSFVQCVTQLNQNDSIIFGQVVNDNSQFQAIKGETKTFATVHRIR